MILCAGEALIDMIPERTVSGGSGYVPYAGGAVFNTAIGLGRLGADVALFTGISTDGFGQLLEQALTDSRVSTDYLVHSDRLTTLAVVQLKNGHATYNFYDDNSAGQSLRSSDLPQLPDSVQALYFGGISLVNGPAADTYAEFATQEETRRLIMLDPNIRPGLAEDEAIYRSRLDRMLTVTDIVKLSDEDLDWLVPGPASHAEKIQAMIAKGPMLALLTKGAEGAEAFHRNGSTASVASEKVEVVDTVGAGDTFNAGALAKMQSLGILSRDTLNDATEDQLSDVLAHAAKVAAVTVSRAGANPPWSDELN
ncbi:2-dehydro-3-deoxygluconokinase [Thalassovita autumnalis]|uniref:2-dehydro-3-deoxygluconokinase n=1 Tax=Thalassovita autumnalis TaxID=2072972 RepID=A0A0P1G6W5_9RHOB|nr:carbohydrate kinase [Thalassovita autumnalis]CUH69988.1 2-dehydro-3-deoxygluconokinase [Thalassovita autumnalis]CUH72382.1 2-dehydro-3-deoxygluconokinase [Thalassovita autumnalis]